MQFLKQRPAEMAFEMGITNFKDSTEFVKRNDNRRICLVSIGGQIGVGEIHFSGSGVAEGCGAPSHFQYVRDSALLPLRTQPREPLDTGAQVGSRVNGHMRK